MKYMKMLGLLAVAAAALMAFAGTAAADTITSDTGETPTLKATSSNATLHNGVGTISCSSAVEGHVTDHGPGKHVTGTITTLTFDPCVGGSVHNATILPGILTLNVTSTNHGTLSSSEANVTVTMFGVLCGYSTNNTEIGTVEGGTHAVLNIKATLTRTHGSFFCGGTGNWTGNYTVNHPTNIHLHNN
jgi:hypothetical protein